MLMVFYIRGELVLVLSGVVQGQKDVASLQKSEMSAGLHSRNMLLSIECCRITTFVIVQQPNN